MIKKIKTLLLFLTPGIIYSYVLFDLGMKSKDIIRISLGFSLLFFSIVYLVNKRNNIFFYTIGYVLIIITCINFTITLTNYYYYNSLFNTVSALSILGNNTREGSEFISNHIYSIYFFILSILSLTFTAKHTYFKKNKQLNNRFYILILLAIYFLGYANDRFIKVYDDTAGVYTSIHEAKFLQKSVFYNLSPFLLAYDQNYFLKMIKGTDTDYGTVSTTSAKNTKLIIVIGESARRDRHYLYGYKTPNDKLLNKEDFLIFNNVHSPASQTITSVPASLTDSSIQSLSVKSLSNNIVNLLKLANFDTTWISMQGLTFGRFESFTSAIASYADRVIDLSSKYDESSINPINNIISTSGKQAIFVHLMGSHPSFENRYPRERQKPGFALTEDQHYDNSITYTDRVLSQIIGNSKNHNSIVFYFSDHGLFYNKETQHLKHASVNTTQDIYNIPFFIWMSESFKQQNTANISTKNLQSRFNNEDLYFTIKDIMKISDNKSDESSCLSLLSECYKENDNDMVMDLSGKLYKYTSLPKEK